MTTICAPAAASRVNISRASLYGWEPNPSMMTRTSTPSASLRSSSAAIRIPTSPSRQPNMRMWTDERAASTSAKMRGKKLTPSTSGSIVAAVDHAKSSAASRVPAPSRAAKASVAARAPSAVTASAGGGQHDRDLTPSTLRWTAARPTAETIASGPSIGASIHVGGRSTLTRTG